MSVFTLAGFAAHCATMEADMRLAQEAAVLKACQMVEKWAKKAIGQYLPGYNWEQLKEATQQERKRLGFTPNDPLLRTGELRASIGHYVERVGLNEVVGYVGSTSKIAAYMELGTRHIPPRSFLAASAMAQERAIHEMTGRLVMGAILQGGPNFRELREIVHILREMGREIKKAADELLDDPDDSEKR